MECPACRATVTEGSRFCPSCGQPLTTRADQRRVATVVFADLVGFTSMSEGADPEQIKNVVDRAFERLVADVIAHGGLVDKIMGDEIIALFGAPTAHEDDPERAVRAALQMQQTLAAYAAETGLDVQIRIGVNTGEVLVGALRAGGDYTAMGDTMNVGSRLQVAARPGQVLVGPATYAETKDVVRYETLGPIQAKGRGEPVDAYAALGTAAPPGHRPRSRSPIMGREQELAILCPSLAMAVSRHRPQVYLISGEAGMGKSRLAAELTRVATTEHDAIVLEGRCVPYGEANIWWPLAAAARQALGIDASDEAEAAAAKARTKVAGALRSDEDSPETDRIVEGLLYLLGYATSLADADPVRARAEGIRSLFGTFQHIARRRPLVVSLSELHWADDLVLEVIDRMPEQMRDLPFVLVLTARAGIEDRWSPRLGRHNVINLHLDALDRDSSRRLLAALLESEPSDELADEIFERSGGNPFFLEELAALLQTPGVAGPGGSRLELPATLRAMVATRLDALEGRERRILDHAAVVGRLGTLEALVTLEADDDAAQVARTLDRLVAEDMLGIDGRNWVFRSDLVREVAYETMSKAERARGHAKLGAAWAKASKKEEIQLEAVAHHLGTAAGLVAELGRVDGVASDISERAVRWIEKAIGRAERRDLPGVALQLVDRALALTPAPSAAHRELRIRRAKALSILRHLDDARGEARAVLLEANNDGDRRAVAGAHTVLGRVELIDESFVEAAAALDQAIAVWREVDDAAGEADALRWRGQTDHERGWFDSAEEFLTEALRLYTEVGDRGGTAWAQQRLAWIAYSRGDVFEAERRLDESIRLFEESNDRGGWGWAMGLLGWIRLMQGHIDEADRIASSVLSELDRESGDQWAHGMMILLLATTRLWRGRVIEAVELARDARSRFESINDQTGTLRCSVILARALVAAGRVHEAKLLLDHARVLVTHETSPEVRLLSMFVIAATAVELGDDELDLSEAALPPGAISELGHVQVGLSLLQRGHPAEAIDLLAAEYDGADEPGLEADAGSALALALAVGGRPERAAEVAAEFSADQGTYRDQVCLHYARGFAAAQLGDSARAISELDAAVAMVDATEDVLAQAISRLARARLLLSLGNDEGKPALDDCVDRLNAMGLTHTLWDDVFRAATSPARLAG